MRVKRFHHLLILAHIWACIPFMVIWAMVPGAAAEVRPQVMGPLSIFSLFAVAYLLARTVLAWIDPPRLRWEYVFPVIDVILISIAVRLRDDPNSVLMYGYFLPIAESVLTLDVRWAASIGAFSVVSAFLATYGQPTPTGPLATTFRLLFLVMMSSLLCWLARFAAELRAELQVAADRNRIAMEMHDGVQADLVNIAMQLEVARRVAQLDGEKAVSLISEARDLARRAADDLRFVVQRLRSTRPAEEFVPALTQYAHNLSQRSGLNVLVRTTGETRTIDSDTEHALFRIVQESLNNVVKHAEATHVDISLQFNPTFVHCIVRDDGRGFTPDMELSEGHYGLQGLRDRAQGAGGVVEIQSAPGAGATVYVSMPIDGGEPIETRHSHGSSITAR